MPPFLQTAFDNLLSPMVLFFGLGFIAARLKSDLELPEGIGKGLSLYLMLAIGFKGGVELAGNGMSGQIVGSLIAAVALSFVLPAVAYGLLRVSTRLDAPNAAAIAAHYGSISVVTFIAATAFLTERGVPYEGYLVAMLALMETPAIVTGLLLARRDPATIRSQDAGGGFSGELIREILFSGSVLLLVGSFLIGGITGESGMQAIGAFVEQPFKGILCLFLLDMGLLAARRLDDFRSVGTALLAFGLYMPLVGMVVGLATAYGLGLSVGGSTLLAVLSASASYIVAPAAMRMALPQANPSLYVTVSLAITFPFNVVVGIPLYYGAAQLIASS